MDLGLWGAGGRDGAPARIRRRLSRGGPLKLRTGSTVRQHGKTDIFWRGNEEKTQTMSTRSRIGARTGQRSRGPQPTLFPISTAVFGVFCGQSGVEVHISYPPVRITLGNPQRSGGGTSRKIRRGVTERDISSWDARFGGV